MKYFMITMIAVLVSVSSGAFASPVQVQIDGLKQTTGGIVLNLFASSESWDHEAPDQVFQINSLQGASAEADLDLPAGTYAFFLYHDVDGNGELKRAAFGLPGEPYAFSNNVRIGFSKPSFKKMSFTVSDQGAVQKTQLVHP